MAEILLTEQNFSTEVLQTKQPMLVDFYADTAENIQHNYLQRHDDIQTKQLGEREFQTYTEEYMGKEAVPGESEARRVP